MRAWETCYAYRVRRCCISALKLPSASLRLAIAIRYWHGARLVVSQQVRPAEFMEPVGHLLGMTAELALKAFLSDRGVSERELGRRIGHDLGKAMRSAIERGLYVDERDVMHVLIMRPAHSEHFHRYGPRSLDGGAYTILLAREGEAMVALARVIDLIAEDHDCLRRLHERSVALDWPRTEFPAIPMTLARFDVLSIDVDAYARKVEQLGIAHASSARPGSD